MGESSIEWTKRVWNPVTGCHKISPGCKFCYAETFAERWRGVPGHPYEQGFDLKLWPSRLDLPLHWTKPQKIFVNSMSDLFHKDVPDAFIDKVFRTMRAAEHHTFQILTKRADRMRDYMLERVKNAHGILGPFPPKNVWLGVSVEDQEHADERIPLLLQTPAAVRWISAEPLLGPLRIDPFVGGCGYRACDAVVGHVDHSGSRGWLDWVVVGGESGHGARRCDRRWIYYVLEQCQNAGIPIFVKQLGKLSDIDGTGNFKKLADPKGGDMAEWPSELRVREFPAVLL